MWINSPKSNDTIETALEISTWLQTGIQILDTRWLSLGDYLIDTVVGIIVRPCDAVPERNHWPDDLCLNWCRVESAASYGTNLLYGRIVNTPNKTVLVNQFGIGSFVLSKAFHLPVETGVTFRATEVRYCLCPGNRIKRYNGKSGILQWWELIEESKIGTELPRIPKHNIRKKYSGIYKSDTKEYSLPADTTGDIIDNTDNTNS